MFAVLYRWKIKPGCEVTFREAWRTMTAAIKARHQTSGSRLHQTENGELIAYAVWPSRDAWVSARALPSAHVDAGETMKSCTEQSFPFTTLDVLDDLLE
jgi:heme-degrading monooxygenase HmoA